MYMYMYNCLKQLREAKKHETIVEGQRLRTADTLSTAQDSTAHDSTPQRNPPLLLSSLFSLIPFYPLFHAKNTKIISDQEIIVVALLEFGSLLLDPGYFWPEFLVKIKNPSW